MYDLERYTTKLNALNDAGDHPGVEAFILKELAMIDEPFAVGPGGCPSCRNPEQDEYDMMRWLHDRVTCQVILRNDLIGLYRADGRYDDCMTVFEEIFHNLDEVELLGTPLHGRLLLNRAILNKHLGKLDAALTDAETARTYLESMPEADPDSLRLAITTIEDCKK